MFDIFTDTLKVIHIMSKGKTIIFRLVLLIGTIISLYFVPWPLIKARIMPLPKTVEKQVNSVTDYGLDGIILYVDQAGKPPEFYAAGNKNRENNIPADPHSLFKIASNCNCSI